MAKPRKPATSSVQHYLLTLSIGNAHMHGYVMCTNEREVNMVRDQMITKAEELEPNWRLPIILQTRLSTGADVVRNILYEVGGAEVKQTLEKAMDYHCSVWLMPEDHPDDRRLMDLH